MHPLAFWIVKPTQAEKVRSEFAHPCLQGQTGRENPKEDVCEKGMAMSYSVLPGGEL